MFDTLANKLNQAYDFAFSTPWVRKKEVFNQGLDWAKANPTKAAAYGLGAVGTGVLVPMLLGGGGGEELQPQPTPVQGMPSGVGGALPPMDPEDRERQIDYLTRRLQTDHVTLDSLKRQQQNYLNTQY